LICVNAATGDQFLKGSPRLTNHQDAFGGVFDATKVSSDNHNWMRHSQGPVFGLGRFWLDRQPNFIE
jgi:hypothetical protein